MNEGSNHWVKSIPYFIIGSCGGFFKQGQTLSLPNEVPNNQLLTSVCHAMGISIASVGAKYAATWIRCSKPSFTGRAAGRRERRELTCTSS
jgi:hypothetical protein